MTDKKQSIGKLKNLSSIDEAMMGRLVADPVSRGSRDRQSVDLTPITQIFQRTSREAADNRNIYKVLPWLHLPREILISSIVSPGDMVNVVLNIGSHLKELPPNLSAQLDRVIQDFFINELKLESKVYDWVDDAMADSGAHPIMVIPEASLDAIINGGRDKLSMESVMKFDGEFHQGWYKPKGLLGVPVSSVDSRHYLSTESIRHIDDMDLFDLHTIKWSATGNDKKTKTVRLPIQVTDNLIAFRQPFVQAYSQEHRVRKGYGAPAFESVAKGQLTDDQIHKRFFRKPRITKPERLEVIPVTKADKNVELGHPLTYHLPIESVVPIYVPGDVSNHTHYIVIADANGYPVSYNSKMDYYSDIRTSMYNNGSEEQESGEIIRMAKEAMGGSIDNITPQQIDQLTNLHTSIVEKDIINRIRAGMNGAELEFSMSDSIKRMMLARTLANKRTTLILVPAEYMIYIAYDYNDFGVGVSLLEDGKALAAQTAAVHVANILGSIQNAIPGKDINIELDPDDGTPVETVTFMAREAMALQYRQFPYLISSASGLTEQLQLSSFNINVSGNPRYPETKTTITARESSKVDIDENYLNMLKGDLIKLFGLTPEMVDNVNQPEFATTAVNNSLLLLKRVSVGQAKTNPFLTNFVRIFTYNSGPLLTRLLDVVKENKQHIPKEFDDELELVEEYVNNLTCALPKPQTDNVEKQAELLDKMSDSLDKFLDAHFKKEYLAGFDDPILEDSFDVLRESIKGMLLRKWLREHGIFRDLDIFSSTEEGSVLASLNDEMVNYTKITREMIGGWNKKVVQYVARNKDKVKKQVELADKAKFDSEPEESEISGDGDTPDDFGLTPPPDDDLGADGGDDSVEEPDGDVDEDQDFGLDEPPEPSNP